MHFLYSSGHGRRPSGAALQEDVGPLARVEGETSSRALKTCTTGCAGRSTRCRIGDRRTRRRQKRGRPTRTAGSLASAAGTQRADQDPLVVVGPLLATQTEFGRALPESEMSLVLTPVFQRDQENAAGVFPAGAGSPYVGILINRRVILNATDVSRRHFL
jgi:hypothetical protein